MPGTGQQNKLIIRFCAAELRFEVCGKDKNLVSSNSLPAYFPELATEDLIRMLAGESAMQKQYDSVLALYESDAYSFVPNAVFQADKAADLFYFQREAAKDSVVLFNRSDRWEMTALFSLPQKIKKALEYFGGISIEHHLHYFLNERLQTSKKQALHVCLREHKMDVIALKNGKIQLINTYGFQTPEDFVYHVLHVFEGLALDTETCPLLLYNAGERQDIWDLASGFVKIELP
ncbi:MAG: DUF3822 family protein [Prevotellaceae bacterium]|jgi:hypothetical protein|nr:DUF3822 family protein [Prevotellaceae bacterium]